MKLTKKEYRNILKTTKNDNREEMDAKDFLEKCKKSKKDSLNFTPFEFHIEKTHYGLKITINGKHFSKNRINSMSFKQRLKYKGLIKKASKIAYLKYKKEIPQKPLDKVNVKYFIYNPRSRDDDANYETLKIIRDTLININILEDDNRKIIKNTKETEIISKTYKIIVKLIIKT